MQDNLIADLAYEFSHLCYFGNLSYDIWPLLENNARTISYGLLKFEGNLQGRVLECF